MSTILKFPHCAFCLSELFATEHAHVRMLSVLQVVFSKPLEREELLTPPEIAAVFPNLDEIIEMHCKWRCVCTLTKSDAQVQPHLSIGCIVTNYTKVTFSQKVSFFTSEAADRMQLCLHLSFSGC